MHVSPESSYRVMVLVGVNQKSNRFVRNMFYDFINDCEISTLIKWGLDHCNIVVEFNYNTVV